jgi:adenylate cyclase
MNTLLELHAQGTELNHTQRFLLSPGSRYRLGRADSRLHLSADRSNHSEHDRSTFLAVPWDHLISRTHATLSVQLDHLLVHQAPGAVNPIFFEGKEVESCRVELGSHFVLGTTQFVLGHADHTGQLARPVEEVRFNPQSLRKVRYHDAENRIEVLTLLPEVIEGAANDNDLYRRLTQLLLKGIVHAEAIAIVVLSVGNEPKILHWDRRRETAGQFQTSRRLIVEGLGTQDQSVLHIWEQQAPLIDEATLASEFDWAFCTPVNGLAGQPGGIYVAGRMGKNFQPGATLVEAQQLDADVKFCELVAEIIGSVLKAKRLERQKAGLRQFFAPPILTALGDDLDTNLLEPCECDVTVMFCDLRGFSKRAEHAANDLIGLLDRVSRALGVMTQAILTHGGVTGDFQGDATLGFWGWPFPSPEAAVNACRAALAIRSEFARTAAQKNHPLADFAMGIGIAHGRAVAGKIGTLDQVKVTVFGPVVNLASRLEGLTKQLRVPIVLDETTANLVRGRLTPGEGRLRRLARLQPNGMDNAVTVSELLPPVAELPYLTDDLLLEFERGVDQFMAGDWEGAYQSFHSMPAQDRGQDFLTQMITMSNRVAPKGWDGVLKMPDK